MKNIRIYLFTLFLVLLIGCSEEHFEQINPHQSFIASLNTLDVSLTFYDDSAEMIAKWPFEKAYTGAVLVGFDTVVLYGHQLTKADVYELSTGKHIRSIETGIGVTNAYYDEVYEQIYMTNSKTNELSSYSKNGDSKKNMKLGNYPMSMAMHGNKLYIINYKDTLLSVVSPDNLELINQWSIPRSSHGIAILPDSNELWIGGHGEGTSPNDVVRMYDLTTGYQTNEMSTPLMPIGFSQHDKELAVVSHGMNILYVVRNDGTVKWQQEVGANPFAVAYFKDWIVVAGYDDATLYLITDETHKKTVQTGKGPFQLLVRE